MFVAIGILARRTSCVFLGLSSLQSLRYSVYIYIYIYMHVSSCCVPWEAQRTCFWFTWVHEASSWEDSTPVVTGNFYRFFGGCFLILHSSLPHWCFLRHEGFPVSLKLFEQKRNTPTSPAHTAMWMFVKLKIISSRDNTDVLDSKSKWFKCQTATSSPWLHHLLTQWIGFHVVVQ